MTSAPGAVDPVAPAPVDEAGVGEILSRARCAMGLSIDDVAAQLKFGARLIEALEQGRYADLPGATFARGMVRAYARLVKLDPEPLVRRMAGAVAVPHPIDEAVPFRKPIPFSDGARRVNFGYALLSLVVLGIMAAVMLGWPGERRGSSDLTFVAAGKPAAAPASLQAAPVVTEPVPVAAAGRTLATASPEPTEPEPAAAAAAAGPHRIVLRFAEASWVEVRDGGGTILTSQLNAAGTTRVLEGAPPFRLVIGNAQHVQLSYDERTIDLSQHARLDVARLTLE